MFKSRMLWLVFAVVLAVRVWVFVVGDNGIDGHHNAFDRPLFVEQWVERGGWVPDPAYPPVHFYLLAGLHVFTDDLELAPRLLSLLCALLAFWPLMALTRRWFGDRAAWGSGLAYAVFPLGVRTATLSLEVAPYLLFLALGFERLGKAWGAARRDMPAALTGALWITLAAATRFDAWAFLPLIVVYAIWRDRRWGWATALVTCLFPLIWMAHQHAAYGDPLHFLAISGGISGVHMARLSLVERVLAWPRIVLLTTGPLVVLAATFGAFAAWRRNAGQWLLAVFGFSLVVFAARTIQGSFGANETKYAAALGLMLLPFAGLGLDVVLQKVPAAGRAWATIVVVALIAALGLAQIRADNIRFAANADIGAVTDWLSVNRGDRPVILGTRDQGYVIIYGQVPPDARLLAQTRDDTGKIDREHLQKMFDRPGEKLIVYDVIPDGLDFHDLLQLNQLDVQERMGHTFTPLLSHGPYTIFAVD